MTAPCQTAGAALLLVILASLPEMTAAMWTQNAAQFKGLASQLLSRTLRCTLLRSEWASCNSMTSAGSLLVQERARHGAEAVARPLFGTGFSVR